MKRIDIDEPALPVTNLVGQTLLRVIVGLVVIAHGVDKLLHIHVFQGQLTEAQVPSAQLVALMVCAVELLAGSALLLGRMTRASAFLVLCDGLATVAMIVMQNRLAELLMMLESATLLSAASFYFLLAGSGQWGADALLRKRAQLKALRDDEVWQRPPYVVPEGVVYDPQLATAGSGLVAVDAGAERELRRRIIARHSGSRY